MDLAETIALTAGVAWASGLNLYACVLVLGLLGFSGQMTLPSDLQILEHPMVISAAAFMYVVEFFADKIPGVDTGWDALHTFIRVPAGAVLAAAAMGDVSLEAQLAAALLGGGLAAGVHATKAGSRALINTSPEPLSNWAASVTEDVAVVGGLFAAVFHPILFFVLLVIFIALMIWLFPKIVRGLRAVHRFLSAWFAGQRPPSLLFGERAAGEVKPGGKSRLGGPDQ